MYIDIVKKMVVNTVRWSPNQDTPTGMISPEADDPQLLLWSPIALTSWNSGDSLLNQQNSAINSKCIRYFFFRQIEWPTSDSETSTSDSETCGPTDSETCCRSDSETWGCWIGVSESGRVSESEYIPGRILRQCLLAPNRSHPKKKLLWPCCRHQAPDRHDEFSKMSQAMKFSGNLVHFGIWNWIISNYLYLLTDECVP